MPGQRAQRVLDRIETAWRPLREAADRLGPGRLDEPTSAGWTAKEMLAHVAFWEEAVFGVVTGMFRGLEMPAGWAFGSGFVPGDEWPPAEVHNARESAWAREQTVHEVLARWDAAHEQLLAVVASVTDDEVAEHADYFERLGDHYEEHLPELLVLLE
jgi:hypothetical protein